MRRPRLVTLSSDLGAAYAAQMKAVLYRTLRPECVVELSHDLPAHDVEEGAFLLRHMAQGFPAGTVHLAIVDPGVGGSRQPVALRCRDGSVLVGPNNGLLAQLAEALGGAQAFRIIAHRAAATERVGATFDGRDLFAPTAARIASGTPVEKLGEPTAFFKPKIQEPKSLRSGAIGTIVHIDRFGNAITNIPSDWLPKLTRDLRFRSERSRTRRARVRRVYEELENRECGILLSSFGLLEFGAREARAADLLRLKVSDAVELEWKVRKLPSRPRDGKYRPS